jgi:enoyl-CoA hydratase/carnithine racemase
MAIALAQQICENSPLSVQACLAAVNDFIENSDEFGWQLTESATALIRDSDDRNEGVRAFFEKRKPEWTGR